MVECDKCPDKLRCTTGQVEECNRGFKLKMCCRKHLSGKKEDIIRTLVDMPNEMIVDNFITYRDICPMCKGEIFIRLQMCNAENDEIKKLRDEIESLKRINEMFKPSIGEPDPGPRDRTTPYPGIPNYPYIGDPPSPNTGGTWCATSAKENQDQLMCSGQDISAKHATHLDEELYEIEKRMKEESNV